MPRHVPVSELAADAESGVDPGADAPHAPEGRPAPDPPGTLTGAHTEPRLDPDRDDDEVGDGHTAPGHAGWDTPSQEAPETLAGAVGERTTED